MKNDRYELQRRLEQTKRLARSVYDEVTHRRLVELRDELAEAVAKFPMRREVIPEHRIRERARDLWEQHGSPQGSDMEFWLRAERELVETSGDHS